MYFMWFQRSRINFFSLFLFNEDKLIADLAEWRAAGYKKEPVSFAMVSFAYSSE